MIALGVLLLILGLVFGIQPLWVLGVVLLLIGAVLWVRPIGGRRIY